MLKKKLDNELTRHLLDKFEYYTRISQYGKKKLFSYIYYNNKMKRDNFVTIYKDKFIYDLDKKNKITKSSFVLSDLYTFFLLKVGR